MQLALSSFEKEGVRLQTAIVQEVVPASTIVKWAGGKKQLLSQLVPLFPKQFKRYFEPFAGSAAVALFLAKQNQDKKFFISDVNAELMETYEVIRDNPNKLIALLVTHKAKNSSAHFYRVRSSKPATKEERAARFLYLNRTCFNGLHRVNSKGEFNVPFGKYKNPNVVQAEKIKELSKTFKNFNIATNDFEKVSKECKAGDFVYFDPPYYPLDRKPSFTKYAKGDFLENEQVQLAKLFNQLDERGVHCMLSNSDTQFIRKLYANYNIYTVQAKRMINCRADGRGKVNEVVVTNYSPDTTNH